MFSKLTVFATLALPLLAAATPTARNSQPTTACCDSTESANSAAGAAILAGLGVVVQDVTGLIGLDCSPITAVGVGDGNACSSQTVSCSNGIIGGIGIGCAPITL
ncbi:uncharacterized protein PHACADRAFT_95750 [Phanerochaete carnosa HHB-10118-sp]|uniref:Hydrophobin n=1 Tax=Phanerochaete carnosa (strain HHB-10118-sp) TaxID=650164 RepID=K5W8D4_PHACS|nr:uncharacterized protein PHACADRAFT_184227 [Phanerochaete carnosa HHB-10118-sp]XP_007395760.1 uncharacterized protein PHACADRAFT_95750 [Phanerochaete carnosa HHB-10118-sp]EKM55432.1 hypothetical protein PHACADRAFT_184227 [Phanerochaete carnosa HHB-10118-sp]EKM55435.1 hypothetical protein PHACADRAFT_95750 [Phanerochaete carnosa HHB-10118-sp]